MSITIRQHRLKQMNQTTSDNSGGGVCLVGWFFVVSFTIIIFAGVVGWLVGWLGVFLVLVWWFWGWVVFVYLFVLEGHRLGDDNTSYFLLISANQRKNGFFAHLYFNSSQY